MSDDETKRPGCPLCGSLDDDAAAHHPLCRWGQEMQMPEKRIAHIVRQERAGEPLPRHAQEVMDAIRQADIDAAIAHLDPHNGENGT